MFYLLSYPHIVHFFVVCNFLQVFHIQFPSHPQGYSEGGTALWSHLYLLLSKPKSFHYGLIIMVFFFFLNFMLVCTIGNKNVDFNTYLEFCFSPLFGFVHSFTNIFVHYCSKKTIIFPLAFWVVGQSFSGAFYTPGKPPTFPALIRRFIPSSLPAQVQVYVSSSHVDIKILPSS